MKRERSQLLLIITAFAIVAAGAILIVSLNQQSTVKIQDISKIINNSSDNYYFQVIPPPLPFHDTFDEAKNDKRINYREPNCINPETASPGSFVDTMDANGNINRTYTNINYDFSTHCDVDKEQFNVFQGVRYEQLISYVIHIPDKKLPIPENANLSREFLAHQLNSSLNDLLNDHPNSAMKTLYYIKNVVNGVPTDNQDKSDLKTRPGYIQDTFVRNVVSSHIDGLVQMVQSSSSTTVVPEYGPIAGLVFTIAIAFIILTSTKIRIHDKKIL
jgi:hypothetical protein